MLTFSGELAAILTSLCYATSSTLFTLAGKRLGATELNRARLVLAMLLLSLLNWAFTGMPLPLRAEPERWAWLAASGVVGLVIGDQFLFHAYLAIGPRLGLLMLSLAPAIATLIAWIFLGETLSADKILGILLTLGGIAWVVLERRTPQNGLAQRDYRRGVLYGLGAAAGQALGLILARQGLGGDFPAISGNVIRMTAAMTTIWAIAVLRGQAVPTIQKIIHERSAARLLVTGALVGPVMGVSLALYSVQRIPIGIASTLQALPPVILLPIGYFFFKERFGWGVVAGTLMAISGVALLFL